MFYGENIEENIDFISTFLPDDFVHQWELDSISNQITCSLTNSDWNANTKMFIGYYRQLCYHANIIIRTYAVGCIKCSIALLIFLLET